MQLIGIYGVWFGVGALLGLVGYLATTRGVEHYLGRRVEATTQQLQSLFFEVSRARVLWLYLMSPVVTGLLCWALTERWVLGLTGMGAGLVVPNVILRVLKAQRHQRFQGQLVEGLSVLSSSLRAGLSMLQAFAVLVEEMSPPIAQEFGLVLKEIRMGVPMEDALKHLLKRLPSVELSLFVTAVLVAKETGGNVAEVFGRLAESMRERRKATERIKTLTSMARLQGLIMAVLPVLFCFSVYKMNPQHFQFFLQDATGQFLLGMVLCFQVAAIALFVRFSRLPT